MPTVEPNPGKSDLRDVTKLQTLAGAKSETACTKLFQYILGFVLRAYEKGMARYRKEIPAKYNEAIHKAALARALQAYDVGARGPAAQAHQRKLMQASLHLLHGSVSSNPTMSLSGV